MASVFVTGSSDGIGRATAARLVDAGHRVVLHARDEQRGVDARGAVSGAVAVVLGDLSSLAATRRLAELADGEGPFDAIIHNAGVGGGFAKRTTTEDGLELVFQVNVLAPYVLTSLMARPSRLVYLTSGLEADGICDLENLQHDKGAWNGMQAYSDSKLYDVLLAFAVARRWPDVASNAVDPGWIRTKLGGPNATDDVVIGSETQAWLATSDEKEALVTSQYFKWQEVLRAHRDAYDINLQEQFLEACAFVSGVELGR